MPTDEQLLKLQQEKKSVMLHLQEKQNEFLSKCLPTPLARCELLEDDDADDSDKKKHQSKPKVPSVEKQKEVSAEGVSKPTQKKKPRDINAFDFKLNTTNKAKVNGKPSSSSSSSKASSKDVATKTSSSSTSKEKQKEKEKGKR